MAGGWWGDLERGGGRGSFSSCHCKTSCLWKARDPSHLPTPSWMDPCQPQWHPPLCSPPPPQQRTRERKGEQSLGEVRGCSPGPAATGEQGDSRPLAIRDVPLATPLAHLQTQLSQHRSLKQLTKNLPSSRVGGGETDTGSDGRHPFPGCAWSPPSHVHLPVLAASTGRQRIST